MTRKNKSTHDGTSFRSTSRTHKRANKKLANKRARRDWK